MKAEVLVMLKPDAQTHQGGNLASAAAAHGIQGVDRIQQGKYFELQITDGEGSAPPRQVVAEVAERVLCNPVIEQFVIIRPTK